MANERVLLGVDKFGDKIFLSKHSWDCGWYWGFGYLGNSNLHYHFESYLKSGCELASEIFWKQYISDSDWWVLRDLFTQAYALKKCAEVYHYGGHQTSQKSDITRKWISPEKEKQLNKDLEEVLDTIWEFVTTLPEFNKVNEIR